MRIGLVVFIVASLLVQLALLPALRPLGVVPNMMIAVVVLIALEGTASAALWVGVSCGLILDLASGANFGLFTGLLVLAALLAGLTHRAGIQLGGLVVGAIIVAGVTVLETVIILLGLINAVNHWPAGVLLGRLGGELVLNLLLMVALRPVVRRLVPSPDPGVRVVG